MPTIELRISNRVVARVDPSPNADELFAAIRNLCTHKNPEHVAWQAYRARTKQGRFQEPPKFINTWRDIGPGLISVPIGRLDQVWATARNRGFNPKVLSDDRNQVAKFAVEWHDPRPTWEHQRRFVDVTTNDWADNGGVKIWRSPAGSGKTTAVLRLVAEMQVTTLIVVPTAAIMQQWYKACRLCLQHEPAILGGGGKEIGPLTIAMQQTAAARAVELGSKFSMIVGDEIQNHASDTCQKVADLGRYRYRLGVSQDERRADGRQFLIYDQFGTDIEVAEEDELLKIGVIVPVDVVVVPTPFRATWYTNLSPDQKFRARATLVEQMIASDARNTTISDVLENARMAQEKTLVITSRVEHAKTLVERSGGVLLLGKKEGFTQNMFDANVKQFVTDRATWVAAGTEKSVGVGFESHPGLARVVLAAPFVAGKQSEMQFHQFRKRVSRSSPGKTRGVAFYILDQHVFGTKPLELIRKWVKNTMVMDRGRLVGVDTWLDRFERGAT